MKRLPPAAPLLALLLSACVVPAPLPPPTLVAASTACPAGDASMTAQLFFGRDIKGSGTVSDAAWHDFLARAITPRFPDGLTVLNGDGQWRNPATNQISHEPSTVVVIVTTDSPAALANLQAIRADYRAAFHQDSVGLVLNQSCASF